MAQKKRPKPKTDLIPVAQAEMLMTTKQKKYFAFLAIGLEPVEAARRAGYKGARESAYQNSHKFTHAFREAFASLGFSIGEIAEKVKAGTDATRESFDERTGEWKEVADWNSRHKFIDTAIELQGFYAPKNLEVSGKDGGPVVVEERINVIKQLLDLKELTVKLGGDK